MENFLYNVIEIKKKRKRTLSIDDILDLYKDKDVDENKSDDTEEVYYVDLDEESLLKEYNEYTVKELIEILKYYEIPRKKCKKKEIIRKIINFELNPENAALVQLRYSDT